jgi:hypothetical protein
MSWTDIGLAIVASGKPAVDAMPALLLQTVWHLLDCHWRGRCRYLSPDGLATAVCLIRTASLRTKDRIADEDKARELNSSQNIINTQLVP